MLNRDHPTPGQPDFRDFIWWYFWNNLHDFSRVIGTHSGDATSVACPRSASFRAYTAGLDGLIKVWNISDGTPAGELKSPAQSPINCTHLSPDESLLLACADDGSVRVWNLPRKAEQVVLTGHDKPVVTACFSPDQKTIASEGDDGRIRLWDLQTGKQIRAISGHTGDIRSLAFHPHKDWLFSTSEDKTARVWHPSSGIAAIVETSPAPGQLVAEKPFASRSVQTFLTACSS